MDQNKSELTFEEGLKQVMQTLPLVIRDYLAQGKYTPVAKSLMTKYSLRIDQGGVLERELMLLLMGIENPDEFTKALAEEASINQQTVNSIVQDVNAQIFVPLREEMARGVAQPVNPAVSAPQTQTPPRFFHLENKLATRGGAIPPRPVQQPAPLSKPVQPQTAAKPSPLAAAIGNVLGAQPKVAPQQPCPSSSNIAPLPPKFVLPRPSLKATEGIAKNWGSQTSPEPRRLLEDHEEPHIELGARDKVEGVSSVPANLPGAMPPVEIPKIESKMPGAPRPSEAFGGGGMPPISTLNMPSVPEVAEVHMLPILPKIEPPMPPRPVAATPAMPPQSYTVDPYREPIE